MARILNNEFSGCLPKYFIVDCRYPYEFDAGHLKASIPLFILLTGVTYIYIMLDSTNSIGITCSSPGAPIRISV